MPEFRGTAIRRQVAVLLDRSQHTHALGIRARVVVFPQEPQAAVPVLVHETVDSVADVD
jgi:hypothetical protein